MNTLSAGSTLLERYQIVRVLKSGGMGVVYEARDLRLAGSLCAVKQLLEEDMEDESVSIVRRKFDEEMAFLASLNHRGIPRIRDFFIEDGRRFLVMDLVDGTSLEQELEAAVASGTTLPPTQVVDDAIQVLEVLTYLHSRVPPVVHRDIKPANLMREHEQIKVLDFGIAREHSGRESTHTQLGTLAFSPLEQIQGHAEPRSDLYALGATMHRLLSARDFPPLGLPPLQRALPGVDPDLAAIVNRAISAQAIDRYDNATHMRRALIEWRGLHAETAAPVAVGASTRTLGPVPEIYVAGRNGATAQADHGSGDDTLVRPPATRAPLWWGVLGVAAVLLSLFAVRVLLATPTPTSATQGSAGRVVLVDNPSPATSTSPSASPPTAMATPPPLPAPTKPAPRVVASTPRTLPSPHAVHTVATVRRPVIHDVPAAQQTRPIAVAPPAPAAQSNVSGAQSDVHPQTRGPQPQDEGGPPGPGLQDLTASLPSGWRVVNTNFTHRPPHLDVDVTGPEATAGAVVRLTAHDAPTFAVDEIIAHFISDLQAQGWTVGPPSPSGDGRRWSLQRGAGCGTLTTRVERLGERGSRIFLTLLEASDSHDLERLAQTTQQAILH